jgi:hypothetical protein
MKKLVRESITDILRGKSSEELNTIMPQDAKEFIEAAYVTIEQNKKFIVISPLGYFSEDAGYGFQFEGTEPLDPNENRYHGGEIPEYTLGYFPEFEGIYVSFDNSGHDYHVESMEDLERFIGLNDDHMEQPQGVFEDVGSVFKPKSYNQLRNLAQKEFPEYVEIFDEFFPGEKMHIWFEGMGKPAVNYKFDIGNMRFNFEISPYSRWVGGREVEGKPVISVTIKEEGITPTYYDSTAVNSTKDIETFIKKWEEIDNNIQELKKNKKVTIKDIENEFKKVADYGRAYKDLTRKYRRNKMHEDISDVLKPKSNSEIIDELTQNSIGDSREELIKEIEKELREYREEYPEDKHSDFEIIVEIFIELISNDYMSSAMEIYLPENKQNALYRLFKRGYDIATYVVNFEDFEDENGEVHMPPFKKWIEQAGWKQFWFEDNVDQGEYIFVKPPKVNESITNVLKPKSKEELKAHFEKENPTFVKIFKELFPEHDYDIDVQEGGVEASFAFSETDEHGEVHTFMVRQNRYEKDNPTISYLDRSKADTNMGIGGVFMHENHVISAKEVHDYVKKVVNPVYDRR